MALVRRFLHAVLAAAGLLAVAGSARAVEIAAPYVPTAPSVVERMLEIAKVGPDDYLIDLGSGDGRIVITAAKKYGARGLGIEIDPRLVAQATANARLAGVSDRVSFEERDLFATDLSKATIVAFYLLKRASMKLRPGLLELKPGTRIVSHAASMGDWKPDYFEILDVKDKVRPDAPSKTYIHFWIVPAKVAGTWRWSMQVGARAQNCELVVSQHFQTLSGTVRVGGKEVKVEQGRLEGDRITLGFTVAVGGSSLQHRLTGRVADQSIVGTVSVMGGAVRGEAEWTATRVASPKAAASWPAYALAR